MGKRRKIKSAATEQAPLSRLPLFTALGEVLFLGAELIIGNVGVSMMQRDLIDQNSSQIEQIIVVLFLQFLLVATILKTVAINLKTSWSNVLKNIGLFSFKPSKYCIIFVCLHVAGLGCMRLVELALDRSYLNFDNFLLSDAGDAINYRLLVQLLIIAPLREEIICRGAVFLLLYKSQEVKAARQFHDKLEKQEKHEKQDKLHKLDKKQKQDGKTTKSIEHNPTHTSNSHNGGNTRKRRKAVKHEKMQSKNNVVVANEPNGTENKMKNEREKEKEIETGRDETKDVKNEADERSDVASDEYVDRLYNETNLRLIKFICMLSGLFFGLMHLSNIFSKRYSVEYALMQVLIGSILSLFYILRLVVTESLWEPILLHCINNSFSGFVSFGTQDVIELPILVALCMTMIIYMGMTYHCWTKEIPQKWEHNKRNKLRFFCDYGVVYSCTFVYFQ